MKKLLSFLICWSMMFNTMAMPEIFKVSGTTIQPTANMPADVKLQVPAVRVTSSTTASKMCNDATEASKLTIDKINGSCINNLDNGKMERWNGTSWVDMGSSNGILFPNGDFEAGLYGWTGALLQVYQYNPPTETSTPLFGLKSARFDFAALNDSFESALIPTTEGYDNGTGEVKIQYCGGDANIKAEVIDGLGVVKGNYVFIANTSCLDQSFTFYTATKDERAVDVLKGSYKLKVYQSTSTNAAAVTKFEVIDSSARAKYLSTTVVNGEIGEYVLTGSATCPAGTILADGSAISRTAYASLFAKYGTTYGIGNGSDTFNIPDFRSATVKGVGTSTKFTDNSTTVLGTYYNDSTAKNGLTASAASSSISGTAAAGVVTGTVADAGHGHGLIYGNGVPAVSIPVSNTAGGISPLQVGGAAFASLSVATGYAVISHSLTAPATSVSGTAAAQAITVGAGDAETMPDSLGSTICIRYKQETAQAITALPQQMNIKDQEIQIGGLINGTVSTGNAFLWDNIDYLKGNISYAQASGSITLPEKGDWYIEIGIHATTAGANTLSIKTFVNGAEKDDTKRLCQEASVTNKQYVCSTILYDLPVNAVLRFINGGSQTAFYAGGLAYVKVKKVTLDEHPTKTVLLERATDATEGAFLSSVPQASGGFLLSSTASKFKFTSASDSTINTFGDIELGSLASGNKSSYINFHSDDVNPNFSARIVRGENTNGDFGFYNRGTGAYNFYSNSSFNLGINSDGLKSIRIGERTDTYGGLVYFEGNGGGWTRYIGVNSAGQIELGGGQLSATAGITSGVGISANSLSSTTSISGAYASLSGTGGNVPHNCIIRETNQACLANANTTTTVTCSAGEIVVGGGCYIPETIARIYDSRPYTANAWVCEGWASSAALTCNATAVCCKQ